MNNYTIRKVSFFNIFAMLSVSGILYDCGEDMAIKYNLHHWDNGKIKSFLVAVYSSLRSNTFLVEDNNKNCVGTFQTKKIEDALYFSKLATKPDYAGKGIGSFCMSEIEKQAVESSCKKVYMEVYDKSQHAVDFYLHKGYEKCGEVKTLKYTEIKMQKGIGTEKMKKLLVIGAGFLQDFVILKAKQMGYYTLAVDADPNAIGFAHADKYAVINIIDEEACLNFAREEKVDGVLTAATDYGVLTASYIAEHMGIPGLNYESAKLIKNKYLVRKKLYENHVDDTEQTFEVNKDTDINKLAQQISYPVMVKPCDGSGSRGASRVDNSSKLAEACEYAMEGSITHRAEIESFIVGDEYGAESLVVNGEIHVMAIMKKWMTKPPYYAELGHAIPCGLPSKIENRAKECVENAIKALGINHGSVNMDMLITPNGSIHIIDIGARMGGNMIGPCIIPYGTGIDYMGNMLKIAVGDEPDWTVHEHKAVATKLLAFSGGVVKKLPDFKEIKQKNAVEIYHHLHEGDKVNEYHTNLDGCGYIIAKDDSTEFAEKKASEILKLIGKEIF